MAVDKLVDSTQLNADLAAVANAIRTKGGTSAQLAFPGGFVSAVQAIPTGITPTGTKQISITENGTTTEDVTNYASAEITVDVQGGGGEENSEIVTVGANNITNVVQAETYLKGLSTLDFTSNNYSIEIETGYTTPTYNQIGGIIRYAFDNTNVTIAHAVRYRNGWSEILLVPSYDALLVEGTKYKVVVLE